MPLNHSSTFLKNFDPTSTTWNWNSNYLKEEWPAYREVREDEYEMFRRGMKGTGQRWIAPGRVAIPGIRITQ